MIVLILSSFSHRYIFTATLADQIVDINMSPIIVLMEPYIEICNTL